MNSPLLAPSGPRSIVHSSIAPNGINNCLTSSSDCCLLSMPTKSFRSARRMMSSLWCSGVMRGRVCVCVYDWEPRSWVGLHESTYNRHTRTYKNTSRAQFKCVDFCFNFFFFFLVFVMIRIEWFLYFLFVVFVFVCGTNMWQKQSEIKNGKKENMNSLEILTFEFFNTK